MKIRHRNANGKNLGGYEHVNTLSDVIVEARGMITRNEWQCAHVYAYLHEWTGTQDYFCTPLRDDSFGMPLRVFTT